MRSLLFFALPALLISSERQSGAPTHAAWHWQRVIVPNVASQGSEQCAVLDASLFAAAAPGLRDVRLLQDGRELAYATDISYDDHRGLASAADADRSLYEVALVVPAHRSAPSDPLDHGRDSSPLERPPVWFSGEGLLPAHVPVERVRLNPAPAGIASLSLRAAEAGRPASAEFIQATVTPEHPSAAFTIGANLQQAAQVRLDVQGDPAQVPSFVLEMRRRELCYQPLSSSPLLLLFGNPAAPLVHYDYAAHYRPKAAPLLASLGPATANPQYREQAPAPRAFSPKAKLSLALLACAFGLVVTLRHLRERS